MTPFWKAGLALALTGGGTSVIGLPLHATDNEPAVKPSDTDTTSAGRRPTRAVQLPSRSTPGTLKDTDGKGKLPQVPAPAQSRGLFGGGGFLGQGVKLPKGPKLPSAPDLLKAGEKVIRQGATYVDKAYDLSNNYHEKVLDPLKKLRPKPVQGIPWPRVNWPHVKGPPLPKIGKVKSPQAKKKKGPPAPPSNPGAPVAVPGTLAFPADEQETVPSSQRPPNANQPNLPSQPPQTARPGDVGVTFPDTALRLGGASLKHVGSGSVKNPKPPLANQGTGSANHRVQLKALKRPPQSAKELSLKQAGAGRKEKPKPPPTSQKSLPPNKQVPPKKRLLSSSP